MTAQQRSARRGVIVPVFLAAVLGLRTGAVLRHVTVAPACCHDDCDGGAPRRRALAPPTGPARAARASDRPRTVAWAAPEPSRKVAPLARGSGGGGATRRRGSRFAPLPVDESACDPPAAWQTTFRPTCLAVHEIDVGAALARRARGAPRDDALRYLGRGGWRAAFRHDRRVAGAVAGERFVLKALRYDKDFDPLTYRRHQVDAILSERLGTSAHSIAAYGFCGQTMLSEAGDVALNAQINEMREAAAAAAEGGDPSRAWDATLRARLGHAAGYARALADLHGPGPVAVAAHHDVKPANALLVRDGARGGGGGDDLLRLKLSDYNDAALVRRNATSRRACAFRRRAWAPEYAAPEAALGAPLTPAIDVYALGGVLHYLRTGRHPYHDVKGSKERRFREVYLNRFPREPRAPGPGNRSHAVADAAAAVYGRGLLKLARACRQYRPDDRPSAREVADVLDRMAAAMEGREPVAGWKGLLGDMILARARKVKYKPRNRTEAHALFEQFLGFQFDEEEDYGD